MGVDAMRIAVKAKRFTFIATATCYRSICRHPFLVVMFCFFIFLYRSFPFLFSLFVSASPVLVCTAVLLGTILSFGQSNVPEIEEEVTHEIALLKTDVVVEDTNTTIVERGGDFTVERYVGDVLENSAEGVKEIDDRVSEEGLADCVQVVDESLQCEEEQVIEETERNSNLEKKLEIIHEEGILGVSDGEAFADRYCLLGKEINQYGEVKDDETPSHTENIDFFLSSSWKKQGDDGSDDGDRSSSDGAESSSPDASMTDIMPMLDELHPLLDVDAPQPADRSHDESEEDGSESDDVSERSHDESEEDGSESDDVSDRSHKSGESSDELDEDLEKQAEEEEEDPEDDERGKEDKSSFVITWDETDQKNLVELGTLELERNKRLESLIARRRLRKSMKIMAEKNLIDLDGIDLPFNIPSISTTRQNPFDLPFDSYDDMGLPPIPGSAPSILQLRRNPFDLPYDSNEEKPDLKGDSFQQEFAGFQQREVLQQRETAQHREGFFRRHESFIAGPSSLGGHRWEKHDNRFKPFFVPEERTSYHTLQRQFSEVSDSKASSVTDTESVSSAVDDEDKKPNQQDVSQETDFISDIDPTAELVEHGSQSSDIDSLDTEQAEKRDVLQDEVEIILGDAEGDHEIFPAGRENASVHSNTSQIDLNVEPVEDVCSSRSSLSSLPEVDERISDMRKEESPSMEPLGNRIEESYISTQPSFAESDFHFANEVADENHHRGHVYDSSPPAMEKYLPFNSISSDTLAEVREIDSSSQIQEVDDNQSGSNEVMEFGEQDVVKEELLGVVPDHGNPNGHAAHEALNEHNWNDSNSSSQNTESVEGHVSSESVLEHNSVDLRSFHPDTESTAYEVSATTAPEEQEPSPSVEHVPAETEPAEEMLAKETIHQLEKDEIHSSSSLDNESPKDDMIQKDTSVQSKVKQVPSENYNEEVLEAGDKLLSSEAEHVEEHSSDKEDTIQVEHDQAHSSNSHVKVDDTGLLQSANLEASFSGSDHQDGPSEESFDVPQEPNNIQTESRDDVSITSGHVQEAHDREEKVSIQSESPEFKSPTTEEDMKESMFDQIAHEDHGPSLLRFHSTVETFAFRDTEQNIYQEEADELHNIDEGLLSELDSVGDFNVKEAVGESLNTEQLPEEETESVLLTKDSKLTETDLELPVLEARSVKDVELAFKQLREGANIDEIILPSMIEDQSNGPDKSDSDMAVVEARTLEELNNALKESAESNIGEQINPSESKESSSGVEDLNNALKSAESNVSEQIIPFNLKEISSGAENLNNALKSAESNVSEQINPSESKESSSEVEQNELVSPKKIESDGVESGVQESSTAATNDANLGLKKVNTIETETKPSFLYRYQVLVPSNSYCS